MPQVLFTLRRTKQLAPDGCNFGMAMAAPVSAQAAAQAEKATPESAEKARVSDFSSKPSQRVADESSARVLQHTGCKDGAVSHGVVHSHGKPAHHGQAALTDGSASEAEHSDRTNCKPKWGDEAEEEVTAATAASADVASASDSDVRAPDEKSRRQHRKKGAPATAAATTDAVARPRTWGQGGVPLLQKRGKN